MTLVRYFFHYKKHRNSKLRYYAISVIRYFTPSSVSLFRSNSILSKFGKMDKKTQEYIMGRVNYYNRLKEGTLIAEGKASDGTEIVSLDKLKLGAVISGRKSHSAYVFDAYEYTRFFKQDFKAGFLFGDITQVPFIPSFVKSRPIEGDNINSVLLPLNKNRHFTFVKDKNKFTDKRNMLIGRTYLDQPHRIKFWEMYFNNPMCDLGNINEKLTAHPEWLVKPLAIDDHLKYKFILCLEGNDVASNLKWVMSSNSLAVMPKPKYETWFMEGSLIPGYHFAEIKADYSDLEERLRYYIENPELAQNIIEHAHEYVSQFRRKEIERIIGVMVANKYFICTGQKETASI